MFVVAVVIVAAAALLTLAYRTTIIQLQRWLKCLETTLTRTMAT